MKRILQLAALGAAFLPSAVFADTAPPAAPPARPDLTDAQRSQLESAMQSGRAQMERLRLQERTAVIGSLSPAHRAALVSILGNLALTPNPDREAAARQIDGLLSQNEARAVLTTHMQARTQEKTLRDAQRQAFESVLTPAQRSAMDARRAEFEAAHPNGAGGRRGDLRGRTDAMSGRTADAGHVLLMLSGGAGEHGYGRHFMGGPGGGPGGPGGPGPG